DRSTDSAGRQFRGDFRLAAGAATRGTGWVSITHINAQGTAPHADSRFLGFDVRGNLLEVDDGGIYSLVNPVAYVHPTSPGAPGMIQGNPLIAFTNSNPDQIS